MSAQSLIRIGSDLLCAQINPLGAELSSLRGPSAEDLLWDGDPAFWTGRAPILFPIVGGLAGDRYRLDGQTYALAKHGFARRRVFEILAQSASAATFRLEADDETRAAYPFDFRLDIGFEIAGEVLTMTAEASNLGQALMPASFGFHPAFRWPLPYGQPRAAHAITFAADEPAPIRRLGPDGTLQAQVFPTPVAGRVLALDDALFADDALIFDHPVSRRLIYGAPDGPVLRIGYEGLPNLGIWSKPGAGYVCIEPWHGYADPAGYDGDFADKPGAFHLQGGQTRRFVMTIALTSAQAAVPTLAESRP